MNIVLNSSVVLSTILIPVWFKLFWTILSCSVVYITNNSENALVWSNVLCCYDLFCNVLFYYVVFQAVTSQSNLYIYYTTIHCTLLYHTLQCCCIYTISTSILKYCIVVYFMLRWLMTVKITKLHKTKISGIRARPKIEGLLCIEQSS